MKQDIENIIKKIILSKEIDIINQENQSSGALSISYGYNKGLSDIYHSTSLIADEVLKVVVEKIEEEEKNNPSICIYCTREILHLFSNLSHNKENKNNE